LRGKSDQCAFQDGAVVRQVVATQHGIGRDAGRAAATQTFDDPADGAARSARRSGIRKIVCDVDVRQVELIAGIEAIALFGDRQRDDLRIPRG
jgi:hypothetical protein